MMDSYYLFPLLLLLFQLSSAGQHNDPTAGSDGQRLRQRSGGGEHRSKTSLEQQEPLKIMKTEDRSAAELTAPRAHLTCHSYNDVGCITDESGNCRGSVECPPTDATHKQLCYILWEKNTTSDLSQIRKGGCWVGSSDGCHERDRCVERRKKTKLDLYFCCCSGDFCNSQADHDPVLEDEVDIVPEVRPADDNSGLNLVIAGAIVTTFLLIAAMALGSNCRWCRKRTNFDEVSTKEEAIPISNSIVPHGMGEIHSLRSEAQGKFGHVFKASVGNGNERFVAVKVFGSRDLGSWELECAVYRLPQMKHENILTFLGSERRNEKPNQVYYWLLTEYLHNGSLHDYLKSRIVSFSEVLHIAEGIACGLSRLHDQLPARPGGEGSKPTVAHRDFKSKNVLLKQDLTPCIADFGLALIFDPNQHPIEMLGQVGTRRYMAPEVLEGAISFYRDSLLRIDMYACGLVFWELMSRCSEQGFPVPDYRQPFEAEVGLNPSLEEMQETVCQQKLRPVISESWRKHPGLRSLCETIEDMWDQDAEARISSSCVEERICEIRQQLIPNNSYLNSDSASVLLLTNSSSPEAEQQSLLLPSQSADPQSFDQQTQRQAPSLQQQPTTQSYDLTSVHIVAPVRPSLTYTTYFSNRSTCASDSPLLMKETST